MLKLMLDEAVEGMGGRTGLKLDTPRGEIRICNYPDREVSASGRVQDKDAALKARITLVENRLYQLIAAGEKTRSP